MKQVYEEHEIDDFGDSLAVDNYYNDEKKFMESGILKLTKENVKSALVYGLLWGLLSVIARISEVGNVFALDWKELVNAGVLSTLAVCISLLKNLLTTNSGNFLGITKVIPPTE